MKECRKCYTANEDSRNTCEKCGAVLPKKDKSKYEYIYEESDLVQLGRKVAVGILIFFAASGLIFLMAMSIITEQFRFVYVITGVIIALLGVIPASIIYLLTRITECQEQISELTHAIYDRIEDRL